MDEIEKGLISCSACKNEIAKLAYQCPACGAPNDWVHPVIKKFEAASEIETALPFTYQYNKLELWGEAERKTSWWRFSLALLVSIPFVLFGGIGFFIALIFFTIALCRTPDPHSFHAHFAPDDTYWESSNEKFWSPVRDFFY